MANRTCIFILVLLFACSTVKGQSISYQQVDSISYAQYQAGQWKALAGFGNKAIANGVDFPFLRLRMAYGQLSMGNYSAALVQYQQVLKNDPQNQTARYFSLLCNKYLGRINEASYQASFTDTATLNLQHITRFGALEAGLETGVKIPDNNNRGTGSYTRASFSNRLGWRLQLDQSTAYFSQRITDNAQGLTSVGSTATYTDSQFEYYFKLGYTLSSKFTLLGAYHYLHIGYGQNSFSGNIALIGLKYASPYFTLQGDMNTFDMPDNHLTQFNGQVTVYPLGNQNLYLISRGALQSNRSQVIFNQTLGFKVAKSLWLQASAGFGRMDNYLEADALYVYNAIDITKFKAGATAFYTLGAHAVIYLNYTFEQKEDYYLNTNYNQNSITGGFTWKF